MLYNLKSVRDADIQNKTILLRADLDVPIENSEIQDDSRLNAWFPTLQYLLEKQAKVIVVGHLGRPEGKEEKFTLKPIAGWIANKFQKQAVEERIGEFNGWRISDSVSVLENIRFYKEEEENNPDFAQKLASLANIYVNDAFATAHRVHTSTEGVAHFIPSFAGLRVLEEVRVLSQVLENPERPLGIVIGGAKIETKLPLVEKMHQLADYVLVGGTIAYNKDAILKIANQKTDRKCTLLMGNQVESKLDITIESVGSFLKVLQDAKTIVWNGPLGQIEVKEWQKGTEIFVQGLLKIQAFTIVGGGDTLGFLRSKGLLDKFSFASTGGGAMLEFLSGEKLPGLVVLEA